jgi:hypothetical protein
MHVRTRKTEKVPLSANNLMYLIRTAIAIILALIVYLRLSAVFPSPAWMSLTKLSLAGGIIGDGEYR